MSNRGEWGPSAGKGGLAKDETEINRIIAKASRYSLTIPGLVSSRQTCELPSYSLSHQMAFVHFSTPTKRLHASVQKNKHKEEDQLPLRVVRLDNDLSTPYLSLPSLEVYFAVKRSLCLYQRVLSHSSLTLTRTIGSSRSTETLIISTSPTGLLHLRSWPQSPLFAQRSSM